MITISIFSKVEKFQNLHTTTVLVLIDALINKIVNHENRLKKITNTLIAEKLIDNLSINKIFKR